MDKFLKMYNLPKLNQEETENLNRPITNTEMEASIKNILTNKIPEPDGSTVSSTKTLEKSQHLSYSNSSRKFQRKVNPQTHSMRPPSTLISKPDKDVKNKENYRPITLVNINAKILNKILVNGIQQHIKKIIHHDQVSFVPWMQVHFNIHKSINVNTTLTN